MKTKTLAIDFLPDLGALLLLFAGFGILNTLRYLPLSVYGLAGIDAYFEPSVWQYYSLLGHYLFIGSAAHALLKNKTATIMLLALVLFNGIGWIINVGSQATSLSLTVIDLLTIGASVLVSAFVLALRVAVAPTKGETFQLLFGLIISLIISFAW